MNTQKFPSSDSFAGYPLMRRKLKDVLTSITILWAGAVLVDGRPHYRELRELCGALERSYLVSQKLQRRLLEDALSIVLASTDGKVLDDACIVLNEYLTESQREVIVQTIAKIVRADNQLHENEVLYVEFIAESLGVRYQLAA